MKKFLLVLLISLLLPLSAYATSVDLELSLLMDLSGSVDDTEFNLQKMGYVNAFNSSTIWDAIEQGTLSSIAVNLVYWSSENEQQSVVNWTLIDSFAASQAFATAIYNTTRIYTGMTGIGAALTFGTNLFDNSFEGTRNVIDVSGDGSNNESTTSIIGRNYALNNGVDTINGIVIGGDISVYNHYVDEVIGGTNAFALAVDSFDDFGVAIENKLIKEINNPVPEPTTMVLFGLGLLGLAGLSRKKK